MTMPEEEKGVTAQTLRAAWPTVAALAEEEEKKKNEGEEKENEKKKRRKKGTTCTGGQRRGKSDARKEAPRSENASRTSP